MPHVHALLALALVPVAQDRIDAVRDMPPFTAPVPLQGEPAGDRAAADPDGEARRVLALEDGRFVRGKTQRVDGRWTVWNRGAWQPVEGVVTALPEEGLLAEARLLARGLDEEDTARRAELARWLASRGLVEEASTHLRAILVREPDHVGALRAASELRPDVEQGGAPAALSAEGVRRLEDLLLLGARGDAAEREVATCELGRWARLGVDLEALLRAELTRPQMRRREFAAHAARRLLPGGLREELATRSLLETWPDVRREAAWALRDAQDPAVVGPALRALSSATSAVRVHAADALGEMGYAVAVEPLLAALVRRSPSLAGSGAAVGTRAHLSDGLQTAYVMDFDVEIAQSASIADPKVAVQGSGVVFDVRSVSQVSQVVELRTVMRALRRLTGEGLPDDPQRWMEWWDAHGEAWRAAHAGGERGE